MHGKGGSKKSESSEKSDSNEKNNIRTTENNIMSKANEILGAGQVGGNQTINVTTTNPPSTPNGINPAVNVGRAGDKKPTPPWIKGAKSVVGKYWFPTTKAIGSGALRVLSTGTGAMLGFAGGVAQGDVSAALKGAAGGGAIGNGLAQGGIKFASNLGGNVKKLGNDIKDTYNEGAYGAEYAQNIKMVREFKQTSSYNELRQKYGDQLTDEKLSEILQAAKEEQEKKK